MAKRRTNPNSSIEQYQKERQAHLDSCRVLLNKLTAAKFGILGAIVLAYFVFSPLLLPLVLAYGLSFVLIKRLEGKLNQDMPEKSHVKFLKFDSIIALALVGLSVFAVFCSIVSTVGSPSIYEGKSHAQIVEMIKNEDSALKQSERNEAATDVIESGDALPRVLRYTIQQLSLFSGYRAGFMERYPKVMGSIGNQNHITRPMDAKAVTNFAKAEGIGGFLYFVYITVQIGILSLVVLGGFVTFKGLYAMPFIKRKDEDKPA